MEISVSKAGHRDKIDAVATKDAEIAVRRKFGRRKYLRSRYIPRYPISAEREYRRVGRRYVRNIYSSIKPYILELEKEKVRHDQGGYHTDAGPLSMRSKRQIAKDMSDGIDKVTQNIDLQKDVDRIAGITRNSTLSQWGKAVKRTFGRQPDLGYYKDLCANKCSEWAFKGRTLLGNIIEDAKNKIVELVGDAIETGEVLAAKVRKIINDFLNTVERVTADAIGTLNSILSHLVNEDSGCAGYIWKTMRDDRVRECHASFEGRFFRWDDPPGIWYRTRTGIVYTGRRCAPGEDYGCRCCAQPLFEIQSLNLKFVA